VKGSVDESLRALLSLNIAQTHSAERTEISVWIDTAFNGGLVIPLDQIELLGLEKESSAEAIHADGQTVMLETYRCCFDWFGETYETQIIANEGRFPLLGTMLLDKHRIEIDYSNMTVELK